MCVCVCVCVYSLCVGGISCSTVGYAVTLVFKVPIRWTLQLNTKSNVHPNVVSVSE